MFEWRPASEIPSSLNSAFFQNHSMPVWVVARKEDDGNWYSVFNGISVRMVIDDLYFIPSDVIPDLPEKESLPSDDSRQA